MEDQQPAVPIHGAMNRLGSPVMIELNGRRLRVVRQDPRPDLRLEHWRKQRYRATRTELGTGRVATYALLRQGEVERRRPQSGRGKYEAPD